MAIDPVSQDSAVPSLAARLRTARVGAREDLDVSRHLFRGVVSYVVRDPITFQSQRFDLADYEILAHIRSDRSLGEVFDGLVKIDRVRESDEERFYQFVLNLHRLSFLRLPVSDDKLLYRRYRLKQQMRGRETARSLLFLRVPLWNPSRWIPRRCRVLQLLPHKEPRSVRRWRHGSDGLEGHRDASPQSAGVWMGAALRQLRARLELSPR